MTFWKQSIVALAMALTGCKHDFTSQSTEDQPGLPRLLAPIEFADFNVIGAVSKQGDDQLLSERVKIGSSDADAYDFLVKDAGQEQKRIHVENVAEYLAARKNGAYPYNTFDLSMDSFFERTASALVFLKQAIPPQTNFVNNISLLNLSVSFIYFPEEAGSERTDHDVRKGLRLRDYARNHTIWNLGQTSPTELKFTTGDMDYDIELVASGDFDHDGFQDGLLMVYAGHNGGSGFSYDVYLMTRKAPTSAISLREFNFWN